VQVSQAAVDSARVALKNAQKAFEDVQKQQATLVKNTYAALISSGLAAVPKTSPSSNLGSATVTVSGTYTSTESGSYVVTITSSGGSPQFTVSGLEKAGGTITAGVPVALGSRGLFVTFSSSSAYIDDTWTIDVPNMRSSSYITNLNAYNAALDSERSATTTAQNAVSAAQSALDQALATLQLKKAAARPADVAAAQAQVLSAQGQVEAASANLENTIIRAPADGTITKVDVKVGEQATALKSVVGLQDVANLYVEANVSEANIAQIKTGQSVGYTFDALGSDRNFTGRVTAIDPASTVISGVVNYKVTASVDQVSDVKPGMTANMSVLVGTSLHALAVPQRALLEKNGKTYVRVVTDTKKQAYSEVEVGTGLEADGGLVEIVRGLSAGQTIVTFVEEKK
jgi:RND family efflux transporter MFP subunit